MSRDMRPPYEQLREKFNNLSKLYNMLDDKHKKACEEREFYRRAMEAERHISNELRRWGDHLSKQLEIALGQIGNSQHPGQRVQDSGASGTRDAEGEAGMVAED